MATSIIKSMWIIVATYWEHFNRLIARRLLNDAAMLGLSTFLTIGVFTPALTGCLLLLSWFQHRRITPLALWGSAFVLTSVATTLIVLARGEIP
jgi:hypothetical protein